MSAPPSIGLRRWRLALGRFAESNMPQALGAADQRMDRVLDEVYGRAYAARGIRRRSDRPKGKRGAGLEASQLTVIGWLREMRALFPASVDEAVQAHAIERFGMSEILKDPQALAAVEPNTNLLKALVAFKGQADAGMRETIRSVSRKVVEELMRRLKVEVERALSGARRRASTNRKSMADFDWRATVRANLKNWDGERQRLIAERLKFIGRSRRRLPWTVILCVDQSGSMLASVIYSAVMAAILSSLPSVKVKLVVFDTAVVDLSDQVADPVEVLMSVQLGGGTDIGRAVTYCEQLVVQPTRTLFVLVSDFMEGASPGNLFAAVRRLAEARVTMLGLAALDDEGHPDFDRSMAQKLAQRGMKVAALTPEHFAQWVAGVIA
jgi:Mg-chelatase subunit ChlD